MNSSVLFLAVFLAAGLSPAPAQTGFPFQDETLAYTVNWPSGLSLGEARLNARHSSAGWNFELTLDAAVPGFAVSDRFHSSASAALCSAELSRETMHGRRKSREKITFDSRNNLARRVTLGGGGKSDIPIPACAHDALSYLFFVRRELGQGRLPAAESVVYGASYNIRLEYTGLQTVAVNDNRMQADRVAVYLKGPASDTSFEVFFARDAARTPLVIRVPLSLGSFSMELVQR